MLISTDMDNVTLKKLQGTELSILCSIDDYCRKYGINYSLYAGTALGAVRHGGFIPWDDDIDLAMTRTEFDRFCKTWMRHPVEGYHLESILTDDYCGTCHAKIRKDGTVFLSKGEEEKAGHHGIWVDVFPLDKVSVNPKIRSKKYRIGKEIILLTRANAGSKIDGLSKKIARGALRIIPRSIRMKKLFALHTWLLDHMEDGNELGYEWKSMSTMDNIKKLSFPPDLAFGYTTIEFEGRAFPVFEQYEEMLKYTFGDYMKLPPESDRVCKHNPVKVQF